MPSKGSARRSGVRVEIVGDPSELDKAVKKSADAARRFQASIADSLAFRSLRPPEPVYRLLGEKLREAARQYERRRARRAELRERRVALRANSQLERVQLPKPITEAIAKRREQLDDDAAAFACPPEVVARAQLLELKTVEIAAQRRPGPRAAPVLMEESLRVWRLAHIHHLKPRAIDKSYGLERHRVADILDELAPPDPPA